MRKNKFGSMFKSPISRLFAKFNRFCLALVIMLGVFLSNPINAQANVITANVDDFNSEMRTSVDRTASPLLLADAEVMTETAAETPEAKAAAKLEAKKAKEEENAAVVEEEKSKESIEAEKLKESPEASLPEVSVEPASETEPTP